MTPLRTAFQQVLAALDLLEVAYFVGGSVASGSYGLPRQTNDIDIVADFRLVDIGAFCRVLGRDFYLDEQTVREAIQTGRPFNAIHLRGALKFDFFPAAAEGFAQSELARRRYTVSALPGLEDIEFPVSSAEDAILAKLVWFRAGGEASERQWHDILGILKVQSNRLEVEYLKTWAARLAVTDLLERAVTTVARVPDP